VYAVVLTSGGDIEMDATMAMRGARS